MADNTASNLGTGQGVFSGKVVDDLQFKSLVAGNNITLTADSNEITINSSATISSGTNLGSGEGLFANVNAGSLEFKSITVGTGLSIANTANEVSITVDNANLNAGTLGGLASTAFLQKSDNLAAVADVSSARTNLGVYSKSESDAKFFANDANLLPDQDNTRSIGDNSNRFSDVYAVEFHGTATRAGVVTSIADHNISELLDVNVSGVANGHVLKYNGSHWVSTVDAGATNLGALTDVNSAGAANGQVLIYNSANSAWEPGTVSGGGGSGSSTLVGLTDTPTNYAGAAGYFLKVNSGASAVEFVADPGYITDLTSFTTTDLAEGTNQYYTDARADARIAAAGINDLSDVDTSGVALNNVLKYNGSAWVVGTVSSTDLSANTTTDLAEGTNLYYTTARANTDIDARLTSTGVTGAKITNWDTAYGWGDHSTAGYLTDLTGSTLTSLSDVAAVAGAGDDGKILYYDHSTTSFKWKTESGALADTDGLPEGSLNLYYTDARADARITAAGITGAKVTNWDTAYGWGDHSTAGYLTAETSHADVLVDGDFASAGIMATDGSGTYSIVADNSANWNTAYGWGDHSTAGYLTSVSSADVTQHQANLTITESQISDLGTYQTTAGLNGAIDSHLNQSNPTSGYVLSWNGSDYAWVAQSGGSTYGDSNVDAHLNQSNPTAGYVLSWNGSDYAWVAQSAGGGGTMSNLVEDTTPQLGGTLDANGNTIDMGTNTITDAKVGNWDTAYGWGDHSTAGYLTAETNDLSSAVTWANVPDVNITSSSVVQHQANLTITESQISDLQSYLTAETSHADVVVDGDFASQGIMLRGASAGSYSILTDNSANWNTAYGWGDHSTAGYQTTAGLNAAVDSHLNQSNPTAGYVLSWNGSDYAWIDNTGYTSFNTDFDTRLATKSTTDLAEGTNQYYTDARVDSRITGNWLIDEDNMASDSATKIPSQQSVKAYVDSQVATANELGEMTDVTITSVANNDFLRYNSSTSQWENASVSAATAAGSNTYVQFNDGGVMGGDSGFVYDKTTDELTVGSVVTAGGSPSLSASADLTIETTANNGNISLTPNGIGVVNVSSDIDMGTNVISDTKVGQWDTAYSWGDHSTAGYLTAETNDLSSSVTWANVPDANITSSSVIQHQANLTITESQISDLQAYLTSETSHADVVVDGDFTSQGIMLRGASAGSYSILTDNSANWNTAYGWGDHSTQGYLTSVSSSDVTAHQSNLSITESQISDLGSYLTGITGENLTDLSDVDAVTASEDGYYLYYDHSTTSFKWQAVSGGGSSTLSGLSDVTITSATSGQVLKYNGSAWINDTDAGGIALTDLSVGTEASASGDGGIAYDNGTGVFTYTPPTAAGIGALADITGENLGDLSDVSVSGVSDGQVLTYVTANARWEASTVSGGGGSAGTEYEEFKINYATNGDISSISNTTSGVSSVSIDSATGGDLTVNFTGYTTPPLSIMFYGYNHSANEYNMNTLGSTGTTLRSVPGGGSSGSPTAFGSFASLKIKVREAETGASRGFGTTTHAWIRFVMGA